MDKNKPTMIMVIPNRLFPHLSEENQGYRIRLCRGEREGLYALEVFRSKSETVARALTWVLTRLLRRFEVMVDLTAACSCEKCQRPDGSVVKAFFLPPVDEVPQTTDDSKQNDQLPN